jgi:hypothetical protein
MGVVVRRREAAVVPHMEVVVVPHKVVVVVVAVHRKEVVRMDKEGPVGKGLESEMASEGSFAEAGSLAVAEVGIHLAEHS